MSLAFMAFLLGSLPEMPMAPPPEDIDIKDAWEKIRAKEPQLAREDSFFIVELLIERKLTDEEKAELL